MKNLMVFTAFHGPVFSPAVVLLFFVIPDRFKDPFLFAASHYFHLSRVPQYAALIAFSTVGAHYAAFLGAGSWRERFRGIAMGSQNFNKGASCNGRVNISWGCRSFRPRR
jgi:hypothetical protein